MLEPAAQTLARYLGDPGEAISDLNSLYDQFALCFRWIELKPKRGPKLQGFALLQDGSVHVPDLDARLSMFADAVRHAASVNPAFKPVNVDILDTLRVAAVQVDAEGFQGEKRKTVTAAESDLLAVWVEFEETTTNLRKEIDFQRLLSESRSQNRKAVSELVNKYLSGHAEEPPVSTAFHLWLEDLNPGYCPTAAEEIVASQIRLQERKRRAAESDRVPQQEECTDEDFVDSDFSEPIAKQHVAEMFECSVRKISRMIAAGEIRVFPGTKKTARKVRIHQDAFPQGFRRPDQRKAMIEKLTRVRKLTGN